MIESNWGRIETLDFLPHLKFKIENTRFVFPSPFGLKPLGMFVKLLYERTDEDTEAVSKLIETSPGFFRGFDHPDRIKQGF